MPGALERVCAMMARAIATTKQDITFKERQIDTLRHRISKLQGQPNPDESLIQELKGDIRELEEQLERDRSQLLAFEDEFAASCRA